MTTFGAMKTRIADEIARDDLASQTALAIASAVQELEGERFAWNEKRYLLATVIGQEFYDLSATTMTNIDGSALGTSETLLEVDSIILTYNNAPYTLTARTHPWMDRWGGTTLRGMPVDYGMFGDQIRLYPIPDRVYTLTLSGLARLPALSVDADTNGWMTHGEAVIRHTAKGLLYRDVIRDAEGAQLAAAAAASAVAAAKRKMAAKAMTGRIRPWST